MIIDSILNLIFGPLALLLDLLPDLDLEIPNDIYGPLEDAFEGVSYVFPIVPLLPIIISSTALSVFRVVWACVIRIKSFIPTMGA